MNSYNYADYHHRQFNHHRTQPPVQLYHPAKTFQQPCNYYNGADPYTQSRYSTDGYHPGQTDYQPTPHHYSPVPQPRPPTCWDPPDLHGNLDYNLQPPNGWPPDPTRPYTDTDSSYPPPPHSPYLAYGESTYQGTTHSNGHPWEHDHQALPRSPSTWCPPSHRRSAATPLAAAQPPPPPSQSHSTTLLQQPQKFINSGQQHGRPNNPDLMVRSFSPAQLAAVNDYNEKLRVYRLDQAALLARVTAWFEENIDDENITKENVDNTSTMVLSADVHKDIHDVPNGITDVAIKTAVGVDVSDEVEQSKGSQDEAHENLRAKLQISSKSRNRDSTVLPRSALLVLPQNRMIGGQRLLDKDGVGQVPLKVLDIAMANRNLPMRYAKESFNLTTSRMFSRSVIAFDSGGDTSTLLFSPTLFAVVASSMLCTVSTYSLGVDERNFTFDMGFESNLTQAVVYQSLGTLVVKDVLCGYNTPKIDYVEAPSSSLRGIAPRIFQDLFSKIQEEQRNVDGKKINFQCRSFDPGGDRSRHAYVICDSLLCFFVFPP